jgi:hypothetical protein
VRRTGRLGRDPRTAVRNEAFRPMDVLARRGKRVGGSGGGDSAKAAQAAVGFTALDNVFAEADDAPDAGDPRREPGG